LGEYFDTQNDPDAASKVRYWNVESAAIILNRCSSIGGMIANLAVIETGHLMTLAYVSISFLGEGG